MAQDPSEFGTRLSETAAQTVTAATEAVQESIASLPDLVRRYPVPSLLIGLGLGYLLTPPRSTRRGHDPSWSQSLGNAWHSAQETLTQSWARAGRECHGDCEQRR
jgi:hypothetical protein